MFPVLFLNLKGEPEPEDPLCRIRVFLISNEKILAGNLLTAIGNEIDPITGLLHHVARHTRMEPAASLDTRSTISLLT